jgi:hypothetical protein
MQVVTLGEPTEELDRVKYVTYFARLFQMLDYTLGLASHFPRKGGALQMCTEQAADLYMVGRVGGWGVGPSNVLMTHYASLADANAIAKTAGFVERGTYYIPRADVDIFKLKDEKIQDALRTMPWQEAIRLRTRVEEVRQYN